MQSRKAFIGFAASEGGFASNALLPLFNPFISAHPPILRLASPRLRPVLRVGEAGSTESRR